MVKEKKRKTAEPVKIMLISETDKVSVVTFDEAEKIAQKRALLLEEVDNSDKKIHTEKKVFKLSKLSDLDSGQNEGSGKLDDHKLKC
jgi:hypothetical protein